MSALQCSDGQEWNMLRVISELLVIGGKSSSE